MAKLFSRRLPDKNAITDVEQLAKLKRPNQMMFAEDTASNIPFMVPGTTQRLDTNVPTEARAKAEPIAPESDYSAEIPPFNAPQQESQQGSSAIEQFLNTYNPMPQPTGSAPNGGLLLDDGTTVYQDGTIKNQAGQTIVGMASIPGGYTLYSDGSIRSSGLEALIEGIFGQNQAITQPYGNVNPDMGYGNDTHQGTDIRTWNAPSRTQFLPDNVKVVEVFREGENAYGNSILVQTASGEMLRFSHLASLPQGIEAGSEIPAGTAFITPGSTGNSTAEHLDLEYYTPDGQVADPSGFSGWQNARAGTGITISPDKYTPEMAQASQSIINNPPSMAQPEPMMSTPTPAPAPQPEIPSTIQPNPTGSPAITAANAIDTANPTGNFDLGITETLRGEPQLAAQKQAQTIADTGTFFNAPELKTNELASAQGTNPFRQLAGNVIDSLSQKVKNMGIQLPEMNVSEAIAGGKTTFTNGVEQLLKPQDQAFAADIKSTPTEPQPPGAGIKPAGSVLGAATTPAFAEMSSRRAIGDVSGSPASNLMGMSSKNPLSETVQTQSAQLKPVEADPFFKLGQDKQYADFMKPGMGDGKKYTISALFKHRYPQRPASSPSPQEL